MHYNLLYYGNSSGTCNEENNNTETKNTALKTIVNYVQPDILTVNELNPYNVYADNILNNVLNTGGVTYWERAAVSGSFIGNMLYYNSLKLAFLSQAVITTNFRIIDVYKLYYKSPDVATYHDTVFINFIVAHLKAGESETATRAEMTASVMDYIETNGLSGNILFMGDLNLYTSNESAYQNLINAPNPAIRFNDPINMPGDWGGNYDYRNYHTQSTHYGDNGCASSGGLDDRFDFILTSPSIMNNMNKVEYVQGSYTAIGQDGNHFNYSVNYPDNNSVPQEVIDALYNMSDHLPVTLQLEIAQTPVEGIADNNICNEFNVVLLNNKVVSSLQMNIFAKYAGACSIEIISVIGKTEYNNVLYCHSGKNYFELSLENFKKGLYIIKVVMGKDIIVRKFLRQ